MQSLESVDPSLSVRATWFQEPAMVRGYLGAFGSHRFTFHSATGSCTSAGVNQPNQFIC